MRASKSMVHTGKQFPPFRPPAKYMKQIPGGTFRMGSNDFYPEERPAHRVKVDRFRMDEYPVTNAEFSHFAEKPVTRP